MNFVNVKIDKLGRIVIPIKFRKKLGIDNNSVVALKLEGEQILVSAVKSSCIICGTQENLFHTVMICYDCAEKIKSEIG